MLLLAPEPDPLLLHVPPHSDAAERAVLGALLMDRHAVDEVRAILDVDAFYSMANGRVYAAALELHDQSKPVDVLTLHALLEARGELEGVGGAAFLAEVSEAVPSAANAEYYARQIGGFALTREVIVAAARIQKLAFESPTLSGQEIARQAEGIMLHVCQGAQRHEPQRLSDLAQGVMARYFKATRGELEPCIQTGLAHLDFISGGIEPGSFVVVGALSSHGKTSLAVSILRHVAKTMPCALLSLEMRGMNIARAIISAEAGINDTLLRSGLPLPAGKFEAFAHATEGANEDLWIVDCTEEGSMHVNALVSQSRRLIARHGVRLIVVDYLQLAEVDEKRGKSREQEVAEISRKLKRLGMQTGAAVVALAQLNSDAEKRKEPRISDIRESKAVRNDADQIWLLWRPCLFGEDVADSVARVKVGKNREGPTGVDELHFDGATRTFSNKRWREGQ